MKDTREISLISQQLIFHLSQQVKIATKFAAVLMQGSSSTLVTSIMPEFTENSSVTLLDPVNFTMSVSLFTLSDCDNGSPRNWLASAGIAQRPRDTSWYYQRSRKIAPSSLKVCDKPCKTLVQTPC